MQRAKILRWMWFRVSSWINERCNMIELHKGDKIKFGNKIEKFGRYATISEVDYTGSFRTKEYGTVWFDNKCAVCKVGD